MLQNKAAGQLGTHGQMPESLDSWLSPGLHFQSVRLRAAAATSRQVSGDRLMATPDFFLI